MSNTAVYFPALKAVPTAAQPIFQVCVAGVWAPALRPVEYEQRAGAAPRIKLALDVGRSVTGGPRVFPEAALVAIAPNQLVTVKLIRSGVVVERGLAGLTLFEGYIDGPAFSYSAGGEEAHFWAVDRSEEVLKTTVSGQYVSISGANPVLVGGLDLVFNPGGQPNMSAGSFAPPSGGVAGPVFVAPGATGAQFWTADQAARYLINFYAAAPWLQLPTAAELTQLVGTQTLESVRVEGRTVLEALEHLTRRVGLRATVALSQDATGLLVRSLVLVGRGQGRQISLYHQMPGETFSLAATAMEQAEIEVNWAESLARLELSGDVKTYESTFNLVAGWDLSGEGEERASYRRSDNPNFAGVADVYRKWVLNETGDYSAAPYNRGAAYDLSGLFEGAATLQRRRRFRPTISTDAAGASYGVYVEVSYDGGTTFARYGDAVRVLEEECGVWLSGDGLPAELFYAAARGLLRVRVTAAVESDARLGVEVERPGLQSDQRGRRLWQDVSNGYHYRQVAGTSKFSGGTSKAVDDADRLATLAADLWQAGRLAPTPCRIGLPFFSVSYRVGDQIDAVRYRWAWIKRSAAGIDTSPLVECVRQTFGAEGWRTELVLD